MKNVCCSKDTKRIKDIMDRDKIFVNRLSNIEVYLEQMNSEN